MSIRKKVKGSLDLLFLYGRGIKAFEGTKKAALQSLLLPVATLPLSLFMAFHYPPKGMETGYPMGQVLLTASAHTIFSFLLTVALVAALIWGLGKKEKFWLYLEACNWTSLIATLVSLPIMLAAIYGWWPREEMDRILVIVACYLYVVTACVAMRALETNWQLAGFLSVVSLFSNETVWEVLYRVQGIPDPW